MRKEEFDFDPDSPGYVGRSREHCSKHNLRDVHDLIDAVQQYYLVEDDSQRVPAYRLFSAARILRAAADRLENELKKRQNELEKRQEEKMRQLRELRLALIELRKEV